MARVTQEEMDRRIEAAGGAGLTHSPTVGKKTIPNPAHGANGGTEWTVPKTLDVEVQRWKGPGTGGAEIEAYQLPDGSWEIVKEQPASPQTPTQASRQTPPGGRRDIEGTPDPSKPGGFDNERPRWVTRDAQGNEVWAEPVTGNDLKDWREARERSRNPGGQSDAEVRAQQDRDRQEADRNKPGPATLKPDGRGGTVAVQTMPDGSIKTTPLPGVPSDAPSKYTEVKQDPNTGQWSGLTREGTWEPISGGPGVAGNQPLPADMPPFRSDPNKPGLGVIEYAQQLAALRASGKLTDKQFTEFVGLAHQQATAEAGRLDTIRSAQQQLQINEINQRATDINASLSRLGQANQATQNAFTTSQQMASNFTPASYGALSGPLLPAVMAVQDARAAAWGGMYQPPPITVANYPMLAALQQMGMGPGTGVPTVEQLLASGQPNALGVGNVGAVAAPGAPAPAGGLPAPIFGPPPAVPGQTPVQAGNVAPGMMSPNPPDISTLTPAVNPPAGQPGNDPTRPVGQAPVILPGVLQAGVLSEVAGSGRYPPEIVAEAARRLGWS